MHRIYLAAPAHDLGALDRARDRPHADTPSTAALAAWIAASSRSATSSAAR